VKLIIGNKTYSSWSMRPWLLLKRFEIPFSETLVKLDRPDTTAEIKKFSASGRVPCLVDGDVTIWDSLAIMEYLNEKYPKCQMWPSDIARRAEARAITCEMHSGFADLRQHLSFHAKKSFTNYDTSPARGDIERIQEIWIRALKASGGPFLFGSFTIADAMYAPVCGRFQTYGVALEPRLQEYCERILSLPEVKEWYAGAMEEDFEVAKYEKST
jgi:glutathione S-transferase